MSVSLEYVKLEENTKPSFLCRSLSPFSLLTLSTGLKENHVIFINNYQSPQLHVNRLGRQEIKERCLCEHTNTSEPQQLSYQAQHKQPM